MRISAEFVYPDEKRCSSVLYIRLGYRILCDIRPIRNKYFTRIRNLQFAICYARKYQSAGGQTVSGSTDTLTTILYSGYEFEWIRHDTDTR